MLSAGHLSGAGFASLVYALNPGINDPSAQSDLLHVEEAGRCQLHSSRFAPAA